MIEFRNITVSLGGKDVISNLSLSIPKGETHVLLGASGSGKSTLLRTLVGLVKASAGDILFNGRRLISSEFLKDVGYVIQEGGLFPHLQVGENLELAVANENWTKEKAKNRIEELMDLTALDSSLLKRYPAQLSGGQRQRIAVARALMANPQVLLMDEPLGALDPITRYDLQKELQAWFRNLKKTVIFVTHDLAEAFFVGDQITLMREGMVSQSGMAKDFLESPADEYVAKFVSSQRILGREKQ